MRSRGRCWRRRAGVAGRCVNDDSRVGVVAHELGVGGLELADEVVQSFVQRQVRRVKRIAQLLRDGLAAGDGLPGFLHDAAERGDGRLQRGQLRGGHAVGGEAGEVGVRKVVDVLAILNGVRIASAGEIGKCEADFRGQGVVFGFDGVGAHCRGNADCRRSHRHFGLLFVLRDAAGVQVLALRQGLDATNSGGEVRVAGREGGQGLPSGIIGIQDGLHSKIHGEFVLLFGGHNKGISPQTPKNQAKICKRQSSDRPSRPADAPSQPTDGIRRLAGAINRPPVVKRRQHDAINRPAEAISEAEDGGWKMAAAARQPTISIRQPAD